MGWADVLTIHDLAALMPAEVEREAGLLRDAWAADSDELVESDAAFRRIDTAIDAVRQATLASLRSLR
jgi:hypothetical protein